jgi:predicted 3-demethylubiquinone-9 3-methyltransferase (glyoxalase superfamily)
MIVKQPVAILIRSSFLLFVSIFFEEAAKFYTSIFKNSKIIDAVHYGKSAAEASGRPKGTVMSVTFELEGQLFMALNGGPVFKFSPAISFFVNCDTQEEVDG